MIGADGPAANGLVAASGLLAYLALVAFAVNIVQTLRGPALGRFTRGVPVPMVVRVRVASTAGGASE